jgi:hypothetical protein
VGAWVGGGEMTSATRIQYPVVKNAPGSALP